MTNLVASTLIVVLLIAISSLGVVFHDVLALFGAGLVAIFAIVGWVKEYQTWERNQHSPSTID